MAITFNYELYRPHIDEIRGNNASISAVQDFNAVYNQIFFYTILTNVVTLVIGMLHLPESEVKAVTSMLPTDDDLKGLTSDLHTHFEQVVQLYQTSILDSNAMNNAISRIENLTSIGNTISKVLNTIPAVVGMIKQK